MESNLVAEFMSDTGASSDEAYNYLQVKGWDLKLAIQEYLFMRNNAISNDSPALLKHEHSDGVDFGCKKLARGISRATDNINLINKARSEMGLNIKENGVCNINQYFIETPVFTFTLPDLSIFPDDFREFLEKDLIEISSLVSLEQAGRLNWWADNGVCQRLWPLATTGDGNCLLHAASLGMWGFHDRLLTLRKALHDFLSCSTYKEALWRRWRWQLSRLNAEAGLVYTEEEWRKEWDSVVSMASSAPRNSGRRRSTMVDKSLCNMDLSESVTYESLEEIHVLALSHVLKRPIVVIADTVLKDVHGEALAPILFGGIYLPLEIPPSECHKSPLVLTFDAAHFSALVVMDKETFADKSPHPPAAIPLTDSQHKLLPVQFSIDPGEHYVWSKDENILQTTENLSLGTKELHILLRKYLDIVYLPLSISPISDDGEFDLELETPYDEEDIEKKFIEATGYDLDDNVPEISDSSLFGTNKSRAAKQMRSVAKQFGSIGKSMSKKLKKNLETITKMTRSNSQKKEAMLQSKLSGEELTKTQDYMFCARLHTEARHEYQEEMIKNYLTTARDRFEREKRMKHKFSDDDPNFDDDKLKEQAKLEGPKNCITQGCNMYGTVLTSYLCTSCYNKQCQEELSTTVNSPSLPRAVVSPKKKATQSSTPGYGTGRSTFYFEASPRSYENAKSFSMTSGKSLKPPDDTIYLSNSTFYNDGVPQGGYYAKDWKSCRSGSNRNTIACSYGNEFQDRPKTWQEGSANQIDGLESLTLPLSLSSRHDNMSRKTVCETGKPHLQVSNVSHETLARGCATGLNLNFRDNDDVNRKIQINSPIGLVGQPVADNLPVKRYCDLVDEECPDRITRKDRISKYASERDITRIGPASHLLDSKNETHLHMEQQPAKTIVRKSFEMPENFRHTSQNDLDKLLNETTEYYNNNKENENENNILDCFIPISSEVKYDKKGSNNQLNMSISKVGDPYVYRKLCLNVTCTFFGSPELENYCSQCYRGRCENLRCDSSSKK